MYQKIFIIFEFTINEIRPNYHFVIATYFSINSQSNYNDSYYDLWSIFDKLTRNKYLLLHYDTIMIYTLFHWYLRTVEYFCSTRFLSYEIFTNCYIHNACSWTPIHRKVLISFPLKGLLFLYDIMIFVNSSPTQKITQKVAISM